MNHLNSSSSSSAQEHHWAPLPALHHTGAVGVDILTSDNQNHFTNYNSSWVITCNGTQASTHFPRLSGQILSCDGADVGVVRRLCTGVVPGLSDVVPLPRVLLGGGVLGLTVVKLWKTVVSVSVTVLWRVEKLSRMVLIRVEDVEDVGSVVGLAVTLAVVVVFFLDLEEDFLTLLAPKSFSTFVLFGREGRLLFVLFFLLLFLVLFL